MLDTLFNCKRISFSIGIRIEWLKEALNNKHWDIIEYLLSSNRINIRCYYTELIEIAALDGHKKLIKLILVDKNLDGIKIYLSGLYTEKIEIPNTLLIFYHYYCFGFAKEGADTTWYVII